MSYLSFKGFDLTLQSSQFQSDQPTKPHNPDDAIEELHSRLGKANVFNPIQPEGKYKLNLRIEDERATAALLIKLSEEPGKNMEEEVYNGNKINHGEQWLEEVPNVGTYECTYVTPKEKASLFIRLRLARQLLMPGPGRWRAINKELIAPGENPDEADGPPLPDCELGMDGDLYPRLEP